MCCSVGADFSRNNSQQPSSQKIEPTLYMVHPRSHGELIPLDMLLKTWYHHLLMLFNYITLCRDKRPRKIIIHVTTTERAIGRLAFCDAPLIGAPQNYFWGAWMLVRHRNFWISVAHLLTMRHRISVGPTCNHWAKVHLGTFCGAPRLVRHRKVTF